MYGNTILYRCYMFRRHLRHLHGAPRPDLKPVFVCTKISFLGAMYELFNPIKTHGINYVKAVCQYCPLMYNVVHFFNIVQYFPSLSNILQYFPVRYSIVQCFITKVIYLSTLSVATVTEYRWWIKEWMIFTYWWKILRWKKKKENRKVLGEK